MSSNSAFLMSLSMQSRHLIRGLPLFLFPLSWWTYAILGSRSSFIRSTCPAHFNRLFTNLPSNTSVCQPPLSARPSSSGPLSSLQQSASPSCFHTPAVYVGVSRSQVMSQGHTTLPESHTRPVPFLSISLKCACQTWLLLPASMHLLQLAPFFSPLFPIVRRCSLLHQGR